MLPKQIASHGLQERSVTIPGRTWTTLVREYTREAGVRQLDRELAATRWRLARDVGGGRRIASASPTATPSSCSARRATQDLHVGDDQVGLAIGLGVTEVGGELLPVEVATMIGKGTLTITGKPATSCRSPLVRP
ncbi:MAG: S16 family serine protease [Thermomicrobiales bacterium]